jgi:hypothetical protein
VNGHLPKATVCVPVLDTGPVAVERVASPQDVWWALEDLWLRLYALGLVEIEVDAGRRVVVIRRLRDAEAQVAGELRTVALDAETYQSRAGGQVRSFIRTLEFRDQDLVCELTSAAAIGRWPEGESLALQVGALMTRLSMAGRQSVCGRHRP